MQIIFFFFFFFFCGPPIVGSHLYDHHLWSIFLISTMLYVTNYGCQSMSQWFVLFGFADHCKKIYFKLTQWGSKIRSFWRSDFKWLGFSYGYSPAIVPTLRKLDHSKSGCFSPDFNYSDKLVHIQVVINCWYFVAPMSTWEDILARYLGSPS